MSTSFLLEIYYGGVPFCKKGTPPYPLFKNFEEGYGGGKMSIYKIKPLEDK